MKDPLHANILIIVPRYGQYAETGYYEFPLGLAYVSAALKKDGYAVDVINLNHHGGPVSEVLTQSLKDRSHGYFLTGGLSAHYRSIKEIIDSVRDIDPAGKVIVGGGVVTASPHIMYDYLKPDYMVLGEGEITIVELIRTLDNGCYDCRGVNGVGYRINGGPLVLTEPRGPILDLEQCAWPDVEGFDIQTYLSRQGPNDSLYLYVNDEPRFYPIISSRGCPFSCTFCYHPLGQRYRSRPVDDFIAEVRYVVDKYDVHNLAIFDELLSLKRGRLFEICDRLKQLPRPVKWMCQLRVDTIDEELLARLKDAGCFLVSYGFESMNDEVLRSMNKHINAAQIERAMTLTRKAGIGIQGYFIFGDPAETLKSGLETLSFWRDHPDYHLTMGYVRPYPGSVLWEQQVAKGDPSPTRQLELLDACINRPPNISSMNHMDWFQLKKEVTRATILNDHFGRCLDSCRETDDTYRLSIECPHCGRVSPYRRFKQRILGIFKVSCRHCNQTMNISPMVFEHVKNDYDRNRKVFEHIKLGTCPVIVTPCMDDAEFQAMAEIFLAGVNIAGVMDIDESRIGLSYLDFRIRRRSKENVEAVPEACFLIPLTRYANKIYSHLQSLGVSGDRICRLDEIMPSEVSEVENTIRGARGKEILSELRRSEGLL
ncbi:MAG: radical SAM protein [Syntrophorhabdaceae bacterium]|nr:radical SAM protein [Syntrophorhabdaceae bacterium]